jgi:hypothetical protein
MKSIKLLILVSVLNLFSKSINAQVLYLIDSIYVDQQFTTADSIPINIKGKIYSYEYNTEVTSIHIEQDTIYIYIEFKYGFSTSSFEWSIDCDLTPLTVGNYVVTSTAQTEGPPYYKFYKFNTFKVVAPFGIQNKVWTTKNNCLRNFPNPATNSTIIICNIQANNYFDLIIYNSLGIEVKSIKHVWLDKGENNIPLDLTDLSNGIYVYTVKNNESLQTSKMVVRK